MKEDFIQQASLWKKGNLFDHFQEGQKIKHHWGRTISKADTLQFTTLTLSYNPLYFNHMFAQAHGHRDIVVNPQLVFNVILGLTVEDCSEIAGPFVGLFELTYHKPVYPEDTLRAESTTMQCRISESNPDNGLVTWHTKGFNQHDEMVIDFKRTNLFINRKRGQQG